MARIIPRELIQHLEWAPGKQVPKPAAPVVVSSIAQGVAVQGDFSKYIQVGINGPRGGSVVISPYELDGCNNLNYDEAHETVLDRGLFMPPPFIFMKHFNNVVAAKNGGANLLYADGSEVSPDLVNDLYLHFTKNHKNVYGRSDVGAWTWLNARFVKGSGRKGLDLETVVGRDGTGKSKFEVSREPLQECLDENCYVDFNFNGQGLATKKSKKQEYKLGDNIYFYSPVENYVAGFYSDSDRAYLYCCRYSTYRDNALGVFGCAEGASAKKIGGAK